MKDDYVFPRITNLGDRAPGMELRDWFAGMAMQALITGDMDSYNMSPTRTADAAYDMADIMMLARDA